MNRFKLVERVQKEYIAIQYDGTLKTCNKIAKEFNRSVATLVDLDLVGKWFIYDKMDNIILVMSHDEMYDKFRLHPLSPLEQMTNFVPLNVLKERMSKYVDMRVLVSEETDPEVVSSVYLNFFDADPIKSSDGQFTGGYFEETYLDKVNNLEYTFSFDKSSNPYELKVYKHDQ